MSNPETIQEFLVSLVWRPDESSAKKFRDAVEGGTKSVDRMAQSMAKQEGASKAFREGIITTISKAAGLEIALGGAALALTGFVDSMSAGMAKLYFSTKNLGTTADQLEDVRLSFQKTGIAVGEVDSVLTNIRMQQARGPGTNHILTSVFGISGDDLKNTPKVLEAIAKGIHDMKSESLALNYAMQYGIPFDMFQAMRRGVPIGSTFKKDYSEIGFDADAAAREAKDFQNKIQDLDATAHVFGQFIESQLNEPMGHFVDWMDKATQRLAIFIGLAKQEGVKSALVDFGVPAGLAGSIPGLNDTMPALPDSTDAHLTGWRKWAVNNGLMKRVDSDDHSTGMFTYGGMTGGQNKSMMAQAVSAMKQLQAAGASDTLAAGIASQMWSESAFQPTMSVKDSDGLTHRGLMSWSPDRWANLMKFTGGDTSMAAQMKFALYEMTQGTEKGNFNKMKDDTSAYGYGANLSKYVIRPYDPFGGEAQIRGARANQINAAAHNSQVNHITVNGAADPHGTGKAVNKELEGLMREFFPVTQ